MGSICCDIVQLFPCDFGVYSKNLKKTSKEIYNK